MANKAKAKAKEENKKKIIGGICAAAVVIVVIVVAVVLATRGNALNDSYFVSDGSKYVLTVDMSDMELSEEEAAYTPLKTHVVYTYSGEEITGMKTYAEYADAAAAKSAYDAMKDAGEDMSNIAIDGKYLIVTATPDQYEGMKASDVKEQIEFVETMKNMNSTGDGESVETVDDGEVVDDGANVETVEVTE